MIALIFFILGAFVGWVRSARKGGSFLDKLQYAAVFGILFALIALVVTILFFRIAG
jgi:hypothetical protein